MSWKKVFDNPRLKLKEETGTSSLQISAKDKGFNFDIVQIILFVQLTQLFIGKCCYQNHGVRKKGVTIKTGLPSGLWPFFSSILERVPRCLISTIIFANVCGKSVSQMFLMFWTWCGSLCKFISAQPIKQPMKE